MRHDESEAEKFNNSELFSFFVMLCVQRKIFEIFTYFPPLYKDTNERVSDQKVLKLSLVLKVVPEYHEKSSWE